MILIKRIYEEDAKKASFKVLVDRIWPRGIAKDEIKIDEWCKEVAPSTALRKWFNHDPEKWEPFREKYKVELNEREDLLSEIKQLERRHKKITLLYAAKDEKRNNAVVLKEVLDSMEK
jgi:uncharacterized protein YeaO (DUF488 family)